MKKKKESKFLYYIIFLKVSPFPTMKGKTRHLFSESGQVEFIKSLQFLSSGSCLNYSEGHNWGGWENNLAVAMVCCPATVFRCYAQLEELKFHLPNARFSKLDQVSVEFLGAFYSLNDLWPEICWDLSEQRRMWWTEISSVTVLSLKLFWLN